MADRCEYCTSPCPQAELTREIAKGRMYAMQTIVEMQKELQAYKDAEEQGLLVRLPCKVGDTVWVIIKGYTYGEVGDPPDVWYRVDKREFDYDMIPEYGKTVFLTREEAEAALAKEKGVAK